MKNFNFLFFGSIFVGIFIWFFFFIITPIEAKNDVSTFTIFFISLAYMALVLGYTIAPYVLNIKKFKFFNKIEDHKHFILKALLALVLVAFVFRYFDLFINREVKLTGTTDLNRSNASDPQNFSLLLALLSSFRFLYFVPLIFYFANKLNKKKVLFICVLLFTLPFLEAYLRGSRRLIFESLGLLIIIIFIFNKINLKSIRTIATIIITIIVLFGFSFSILKGRVSENTNEFYSKIFNSQYNEFVPPKHEAVKFLQENNESVLSHIYFSEIHLGQYITHGVFEMDYMIASNPKHTYGLFNFYSLVKFSNKLGISNVPLESLNNPTKRITYITFFGGMFLDFGWYTLVFMFLFGIIQNKTLFLSKKNYFFLPISILFLFFNGFMLIFNFLRAQFILSLSVYLFFFLLIFLVFNMTSLRIISRN